MQGRGARGPPPRAVLEAGLCVLPAGSSTQPLHSLASQGAPRPPPHPARGPDISCVGAEESPAVVVTSVPRVGWPGCLQGWRSDSHPNRL